ncbi:hypothetical protein RF11_10314 [Thelohanellus kitauei]|uniref:Uncharacterized protein n=1 Tax=Thelohanellus kitauei TaxID=669202 RepID=A0A0C2IK63_THEKT|nr:hypothetical protein RF11_10314 [Thelohanellus kitauei]
MKFSNNLTTHPEISQVKFQRVATTILSKTNNQSSHFLMNPLEQIVRNEKSLRSKNPSNDLPVYNRKKGMTCLPMPIAKTEAGLSRHSSNDESSDFTWLSSLACPPRHVSIHFILCFTHGGVCSEMKGELCM